MSKKAYNLALSIYSHIRHHDYRSAKYLLLELIEIVEEFVKEEEQKNEAEASKK